MLASQQFCVKWNSYSSNLQNVFPRLLTSEHFVDITLACEGQMIKCHKVVLSACSTYFEKLLIQNPCQHPIIFMKDMKHWEVQALVDFMYKGEVNVSQDELNSLLVAAEALQIRGLCGSDSTNRNPQDPPKINSPTVSPPKVPPVSLPHDTVLSGSSSFGRESPPAIKRKRSNDEKDVIPKITNAMPTTQGRSPSVPNNSEGNSLLAQSSGDVDRNSKIEGQAEEGSEEEKKVIKQEIDMDDTFGDGEVDGDAADEDYANQGQQASMYLLPGDYSSYVCSKLRKWSASQTHLLIRLRKEYDQLFKGKRVGKGWALIANEMNADGLDAKSCKKKWHNLLTYYKDDSDSTLREDGLGPSLLDQPGPSGMIPAGDKTATDFNAALALQNVMCVLSPSHSNMSPPQQSLSYMEGKDYPIPPSPGMGGATRIRRSEAELRKAAECVQKGMTFQNVSDIFNIPISTIRFYMARRGILPQRRRGRISNSNMSPAAAVQGQQAPYMVLHYKLPDISKKPN